MKHLLTLFVLLISTASAQLLNQGEVKKEVFRALSTRQWDVAIEKSEEIIEIYGENARKSKDASLGEFYYLKGRAELAKKEYRKAQESFETCYKDFPSSQKSANKYDISALAYWAETELKLGNGRESIKRYNEYLKESNTQTAKQKATIMRSLYSNLAIANFQLEKFDDGIAAFETALSKKKSLGVSTSSLAYAINQYAANAKDGEGADKLTKLVVENQNLLQVNELNYITAGNYYANAALRLLGTKQFDLVIALSGLTPENREVLATIDSLADTAGKSGFVAYQGSKQYGSSLNRMKPGIEKSIAEDTDPAESLTYARAMALAANGLSDIAYRSLNTLFEKNEKTNKREEYLARLQTLASQSGRTKESDTYFKQLLKEFPETKFLASAIPNQVQTLMGTKKYDELLSYVDDITPKLPKDSPLLDLLLYSKGVSQLRLKDTQDAINTFGELLTKFPTSRYKKDAQYYQASLHLQINRFEQAEALLSQYVKDYSIKTAPSYYPNALNLLATSLSTQKGKEKKALEMYQRVAKEFPTRIVAARANLAASSIQKQLKDKAGAETSLKAAIKTAEKLREANLAANAYVKLIELTLQDSKKALASYDQFYKKYNDSYYAPKATNAVVDSLAKVNRAKDALAHLEAGIKISATNEDIKELKSSLSNYSNLFLEKKSPNELKDKLLSINIPKATDSVKITLLMETVVAFTNAKQELADAGKSTSAVDKTITELFSTITTQYSPKDSDNYSLVRVGDYLRDNGSFDEAEKYYQEGLTREGNSYLTKSRYGVAAIADAKKDYAKAVRLYDAVVQDKSAKLDYREKSLFSKAQIELKQKNYAAFKDSVKLYANNSWSEYSTQLRYDFATVVDQEGDIDAAIKSYDTIWRTTFDNTLYSLKSINRWMELLWKRDLKVKRNANGRPEGLDDRIVAYNGGKVFVEGFEEAIKQQGLPKELESDWNTVKELVNEYRLSSEVKEAIATKVIRN